MKILCAFIALMFATGAFAQTPTMTAPRFKGSAGGETVLRASPSATGTLTLPPATDTLVGRNTVDTLTNKSISGEQVNSGTIALARMGAQAGKTVLCNPSAGSAIFAACTDAQFAGVMSAFMPGWSTNVAATNMPGLDNGRFFIYQHPASYSIQPPLWVQKDVPSAGGVTGNSYPALWAVTNTHADDAGFQWTANVQMNNKTKKSTLAENVAVNAYAKKLPTGDGTETGTTWGANIVCDDKSTFAPPTAGCIGAEIAVSADAGGADPNGVRRAVQIVGGGPNGTVHGAAVFVGPRPGVTFNRAYTLQSTGGGNFNAGFDTTDAVLNSGVALMMRDNQRIAFDGAPNGAFNRSMYYNAGLLVYSGANGNVYNLNDDGVITAGRAASGGVRLSLTNSAGTCTLTPTASTAAFSCSSDERLKDNINDARSAAEWLRDFRVREYTVKATGEKTTGVIAQEVRKTHADMVHEGQDGILSVDAPNVWKLVKAIQEQQAQIYRLQLWCAGLTAALLVLFGTRYVAKRRA